MHLKPYRECKTLKEIHEVHEHNLKQIDKQIEESKTETKRNAWLIIWLTVLCFTFDWILTL